MNYRGVETIANSSGSILQRFRDYERSLQLQTNSSQMSNGTESYAINNGKSLIGTGSPSSDASSNGGDSGVRLKISQRLNVNKPEINYNSERETNFSSNIYVHGNNEDIDTLKFTSDSKDKKENSNLDYKLKFAEVNIGNINNSPEFNELLHYEDYGYDNNYENSDKSSINRLDIDLANLQSCLWRDNNIIHELYLKLRLQVALSCGIVTSIMISPQSSTNKMSSLDVMSIKATRDLLTIAAYIVFHSRLRPELLITASLKSRDTAHKLYFSFLILHRLCNPLSMSYHVINPFFEVAKESQIYHFNDIHYIDPQYHTEELKSRLLFFQDPMIASNWNPSMEPLPIQQGIFTCFLQVLSIRRDVSFYFRSIWHQAIQSINKVMIGSLIHPIDILKTSKRVLECTFKADWIQYIPIPIISVCKSIFKDGGIEALHHYYLNFLILPNLMKIVCGDIDCLENEQIINPMNVTDLVNQYYNTNLWWTHEWKKLENGQVRRMIWFVWRLYSRIAYIDNDEITSKEFFEADDIDFADHKLKYMLISLREKLDNTFQLILSLPDDEYSNQTAKPIELLSLSVMSRAELSFLCDHVSKIYHDSSEKRLHLSLHEPIYHAMTEFMMRNSSFDHECHPDDLMVLNFQSSLLSTIPSTFDCEYNIDPSDEFRKLNYYTFISSRYIEMLTGMINRVSRSSNGIPYPTLDDLVANDSELIHPEINRSVVKSSVPLFDDQTKVTKSIKERFKSIKEGKDFKSLVNVHQENIKALRFGSAHPSSSVSSRFHTSLKSQRIHKDVDRKPSPEMSKSQLSLQKAANGSVYTIPTISSNSSLLVPTKSKTAQPLGKTPTRFVEQEMYESSMREYNIIPTNEFLRKIEKIARERELEATRTRYRSRTLAKTPTPKPFPNHLKSKHTSTRKDSHDTEAKHLLQQFNDLVQSSASLPFPTLAETNQKNHYMAPTKTLISRYRETMDMLATSKSLPDHKEMQETPFKTGGQAFEMNSYINPFPNNEQRLSHKSSNNQQSSFTRVRANSHFNDLFDNSIAFTSFDAGTVESKVKKDANEYTDEELDRMNIVDFGFECLNIDDLNIEDDDVLEDSLEIDNLTSRHSSMSSKHQDWNNHRDKSPFANRKTRSQLLLDMESSLPIATGNRTSETTMSTFSSIVPALMK